jgi:ATP-dependent DNA ligase
MELPTLYSLNSHKKVVKWTVSVYEANGVGYVKRVWGVEGGKFQDAVTEIKSGKNIGRKNETTVLQQAQLKAKSFYNKRVDEGNTPSRKNITDVVILPMLAHGWTVNDNRMPDTVMVQPKIDGVRALICTSKGVITICSRTGKPIKSVPHLCTAVEALNLPSGTYLDGELYTDEIKFEDISGACRRLEPDKTSEKLKFYVFDCFNVNVSSVPFADRYSTLQMMEMTAPLVLVETKTVTKLSIDVHLDSYIKQGYEGVMIRDPSSPYTLNERSRYLLKYKRFFDDEYKIVHAKEATGRDKGTVVWVCETNNGVEFSCRPQGTVAHRSQLWANHHEHIGKMLTVRYQEMTRDGIPRFPVGIDIRDYE